MDYIVPIIGAISVLVTAYVAVRKASEDGAAGAAARWEKLVVTLQQRIEKLEDDRDIGEKEVQAQQQEINAQLKRIRELEHREHAANERLLKLEDDHGDLVQEYARLKKQFARLAKRVEYYKRGVALLVAQILEHGLEPAWQPNHEEEEDEQ